MMITGIGKACHLAFSSVYDPSFLFATHFTPLPPSLHNSNRSKNAPPIVNQARGWKARVHSHCATAEKADTTAVAAAAEVNHF